MTKEILIPGITPIQKNVRNKTQGETNGGGGLNFTNIINYVQA